MNDDLWMGRALAVAETARLIASPNPWVGCVIVCTDGHAFEGATEAAGGRHAERVALDAARVGGANTVGATVYTTLEPCSHKGRTGPCTDALIAAQVARVVSAVRDPDERVAGTGYEQLRSVGIVVVEEVQHQRASRQLAPYLHHRRTGRPFVVLKLASSLDGRTAAADGTSQWITGPQARRAAHQLRAESDVIVVGAGTVRTDDPALTVRLVNGPNPRRVVLGLIPANAKVHPCLQWQGPLEDLLDQLGNEGVLQVMVEGGASVAGSFHRAGLVQRYVLYLAPTLMGGSDGVALLAGAGAGTLSDAWRGRIVSTRQLGDDIEIVLEAQ